MYLGRPGGHSRVETVSLRMISVPTYLPTYLPIVNEVFKDF